MTSANVTYYLVYKDGKFVKEHRQNCMCKNWVKKELSQYKPVEDYTLILRWPDENEADHYSERMSLQDYLSGKKIVWKNYED